MKGSHSFDLSERVPFLGQSSGKVVRLQKNRISGEEKWRHSHW